MPTKKENRTMSDKTIGRDTKEVVDLLTSILEDVRAQVEVGTPKLSEGASLAAKQQYKRITASFGLKYPPETPGRLKAKAVSIGQINLIWTYKNANNIDGFRIERCAHDECDDFVEVQQIDNPKATNYEDTNLTADTRYRYRVRAFNICGDSSYSHVTEAKTFDVADVHSETVTI